ncbi:MAG: DUF547 domain-containing protein [Bacteroidota bacterium]
MKHLPLLLFCMFAGISSGAYAQDTETFFSKTDSFLKAYVKEGRVAYKDIKSNPAELDELIALAENIAVSSSDPHTYQAFWINAYNLLVIKSIVANYPIASPLDKSGFFDKTKHKVSGMEVTLNGIENDLLRAVFPDESRFHFVLVCAGLGCPPIIPAAYTPEKLEAQLQKQTELALNRPDFVKVKGKKVLLSQIFEWYNGDFTKNNTSLVEYVNQYRTEKLDAKSKVGYYPYDWALNEIK